MTKTELMELVISLSAENLQLKKENEDSKKSRMLFCDLLEMWLERQKSRVRLDTYVGYANHVFKHLIPYFSPLRLTLNDIVPSVIEKYFDYKLSAGLKISTIKHHYVTIKSAMNFALRDGLVTNNKYTTATLPAPVEKYEYNTLSIVEINYLLKNLKSSDIFLPVLLGCILGMRRSEIVGLKWSCVDFMHNALKIRGTYIVCYDSHNGEKYEYWTAKTKTSCSNREYYMPQNLMTVLKETRLKQIYLYEKVPSYSKDFADYVCLRNNGTLMKPDYISKKFMRIMKKLFPEKHIRFHDLRHSCGTLLHDDFGYDCKDIQSYLGHSSAAFTANTYIHTTSERKGFIAKDFNKSIKTKDIG